MNISDIFTGGSCDIISLSAMALAVTGLGSLTLCAASPDTCTGASASLKSFPELSRRGAITIITINANYCKNHCKPRTEEANVPCGKLCDSPQSTAKLSLGRKQRLPPVVGKVRRFNSQPWSPSVPYEGIQMHIVDLQNRTMIIRYYKRTFLFGIQWLHAQKFGFHCLGQG